jgi:hypothetical protein
MKRIRTKTKNTRSGNLRRIRLVTSVARTNLPSRAANGAAGVHGQAMGQNGNNPTSLFEVPNNLEERICDPITPGETEALENYWHSHPRWQGINRCYSEKVFRLRGSLKIEHTIAEKMSAKLWDLLQNQEYLHALGALTGNQAVQMAQAGLRAIYLSGWQVAADNNLGLSMYPVRVYTLATVCRWRYAASTRPCSEQTKFNC